jgi:hypothetical protein
MNGTGESRRQREEQEVIAVVKGDEEAVADFRKLVETRKPEHSKVSNIAFEDYEGDVKPQILMQ